MSEHGIIDYWPQMSETEADLERQNILADIRRGTRVPFSVQRKRAEQKQVVTAVTVREAATMFYNDIKGGLTARGREGMLWRIGHLLGFFARPDDPEDDPRNERVDWTLPDVDHAAVSAYRRQKRGETRLRKGKTVPRLTPVNVNKTVEALARIIKWAKMERGRHRRGLRDFLLEYKARTRWPGRDDHLVPTAKGKRRTNDSVRQRMLNPTIARAAELADERELPQAFPETLGKLLGRGIPAILRAGGSCSSASRTRARTSWRRSTRHSTKRAHPERIRSALRQQDPPTAARGPVA